MPDRVRMLGFSAEHNSNNLLAAMRAVPGPELAAFAADGLVALSQDVADDEVTQGGDPVRALRRLHVVQQRLEAACGAADFLPADPAHACCARAAAAGLLHEAAADIAGALARAGGQHQWDVVLRWRPEAVLAARRAEIAAAVAAGGGGKAALAAAVEAALVAERARRDAALRSALGAVATAMAPAGAEEAATGVTVMLPAGHGEKLERVLDALPADIAGDATIDLRGPLPPLSFAAVRIDAAAPGDIAAAWQALALPDNIDAAQLHRHWRSRAALLHPDRQNGRHAAMAAAGAAFRLLRGLLPSGEPGRADDGGCTLPALQRRGAGHMRICAPAQELAP